MAVLEKITIMLFGDLRMAPIFGTGAYKFIRH
jgi:hypothetical protein